MRLLNVPQPVRQWMWGHATAGWIAWVDPKDAQRIDRENKKKKRSQRVSLWEGASLLCWPAISLLGGCLYIDEVRNTGKGPYGHVVGIPADAALGADAMFTYPGWVHIATSTSGQVILKSGFPSFMPVYAREGRRGKATGSLWIPMDFLEIAG
jgi:hypothetical protein